MLTRHINSEDGIVFPGDNTLVKEWLDYKRIPLSFSILYTCMYILYMFVSRVLPTQIFLSE